MTARPKLQRSLLVLATVAGLLVAAAALEAAGAGVEARPASASPISTTTSTTVAQTTTASTSPSGPTWQAYPSTSVQPPARQNAAMAYDAASGQVIAFGGAAADGSILGDTWIWTAAGWQQAHPIQSPPPLQGASMAYDSQLRELVLFGGETGANPPAASDTTWAWNGGSWYELPTQAPPPARYDAALASDGGGFVLFGGTAAGGGVLGDTWTFDGKQWTEQSPSISPPARAGAAITWDPSTGRAVLFGGQTSSSCTSGDLGDTWTWDGTNWFQFTGAAPSARSCATLAYDADMGGDVLAGGASAGGLRTGSWLFQGSWASLPAAPPARTQASAAWDSATHQLVLFGGSVAGGSVVAGTYLLAAPATPPVTTTTTAPPGTTTSPPTSAGHLRRAPTTSPTTLSRQRRHTVTRRSTPSPVAVAPAVAPAPSPALRPTSTNLHQGETITLKGWGFAPGAVVTLTFHSQPVALGTVVANAEGRFQRWVTVPDHAVAGRHHLEASGKLANGSIQTLATPVRVVIPTSRPLAETLAMVALALIIPLVTWIVLDLRSRRRRRVPVAG